MTILRGINVAADTMQAEAARLSIDHGAVLLTLADLKTAKEKAFFITNNPTSLGSLVCEALPLVTTVAPTWVHACISQGVLLDATVFPPSKTCLFDRLTIKSNGLLPSFEQSLKAMVLNHGGTWDSESYSDANIANTETCMVTADADPATVNSAVVIAPQWIQDCINLRQRLPLAWYSLQSVPSAMCMTLDSASPALGICPVTDLSADEPDVPMSQGGSPGSSNECPSTNNLLLDAETDAGRSSSSPAIKRQHPSDSELSPVGKRRRTKKNQLFLTNCPWDMGPIWTESLGSLGLSITSDLKLATHFVSTELKPTGKILSAMTIAHKLCFVDFSWLQQSVSQRKLLDESLFPLSVQAGQSFTDAFCLQRIKAAASEQCKRGGLLRDCAVFLSDSIAQGATGEIYKDIVSSNGGLYVNLSDRTPALGKRHIMVVSDKTDPEVSKLDNLIKCGERWQCFDRAWLHHSVMLQSWLDVPEVS